MSANPPQTKEYYVKVAKTDKRYHALKFHISDNVDFKTTAKPEMTREQAQYYQRIDTESQPKFGAGTEFGKEGREIARRKKFGWSTKGTSLDDLPWLLSMKGEDGKEKQYRGKKSVSDNSCHFIFVHNSDGGFDAYPLEDWYSFVSHKTYKTLNIEEAEEEFSKRHTILNKYTIMANKRKTEAKTDGDDGEETKKGKGKTKRPHGFALTEMDYWSGGEENLEDDDEEGGEREGSEGSDKKTKKKAAAPKKKNGGGDEDDENIGKVSEESDDGDREGEELDYSTSESESEEELETTKAEEKYKEIGIDEEVAIKAFDEDEDEDNDLTEEGKEYNKLIHEHAKEEIKDVDELSKDSAKKSSADDFNESDFSDSSSFDDIDNEPIIPTKVLGSKKKAKDTSSTSSGATTKGEPSSAKRKAADDLGGKSTKKQATTSESSESKPTTSAKSEAASSKAESSSNKFEDEVRHYLRKPMTTKEIIQKLKKKSSLPNDKLQENISNVLHKLSLAKQLKIEEINGVKYLSLLKP